MTRVIELSVDDERQTIVLPKGFRFKCGRIYVRRVGDSLLLTPADAPGDGESTQKRTRRRRAKSEKMPTPSGENTGYGDTIFKILDQFSPDFMDEGRCQPDSQEREEM